MNDGGTSKPVPDPTVFTTQQLLREIGLLREQQEREIMLNREIIETRLDAMDKAIALLQAQADRVPSEVDLKTTALKDLVFEKFQAVNNQFIERDVRTEQTSRDAKTAVDTALQAAKEAVGKQNDAFVAATEKQEAAFTKQIDAQGTLIAQMGKSLEDKINDVKERISTGERAMSVNAGRSSGMDASWGYIIAIAFVALAAASAAAAFTGG